MSMNERLLTGEQARQELVTKIREQIVIWHDGAEDLTYLQIGRKLGIDGSMARYIVKEKRNVSLKLAQRIARRLKL